MDRLLDARKFDQVGGMMLPDYVYWRNVHNPMRRERLLAIFKEEADQMPDMKVTHHVDSTRIHDKSLTVHSTRTIHGTEKGKDHKRHVFNQRAKIDDVWVLTSKTWMLKSSRVISAYLTIDGQDTLSNHARAMSAAH